MNSTKPAARGVAVWIGLSVLVAVAVLASTLLVAQQGSERTDPLTPSPPFAAGGAADAIDFFVRNALVAFLLAGLGYVISRVGERAATPDQRRRAVVGAVLIACVFPALQAIRQGRALAWISQYLSVPSRTLWVAVLPHSVLELTAIAMPLVAAALMLRRASVRTTSPSVWQALVIALPLIAIAAALETYVSPSVYRATACTTQEPEFEAQGGCKPCPKSAERALAEAGRTHDPMPKEAAEAFDAGCIQSTQGLPEQDQLPVPAPRTDTTP